MARQYGTKSISSEEAHAYVEAQRKEAEAKRLKTEKMIAIGAVAVGVIVLGTGIFAKVTGPSRIAELDAQIAANTETLTEKQQFIEEGGNIVYVDPVMSSAKEAGLRICDLQNQLMEHDTTYWINLRSMPDDSRLDFTDEHKACLAEFQSWIRETETGTTAATRSGNGIWSYYGKWEFHDIFDYEGDELSIVWMCYDVSDVNKSQPLAFVTGTYSSYYNQVSNLTRYITPAYTAMVNNDSLRTTSAVQQTEVYNPDSSILQFDQADDPSTGAPNGLTPEEIQKWNEEHMSTGTSTSTDASTGTTQSTSQWTSPSASSGNTPEGTADGSEETEDTIVMDMGE